MILAMLVCFIVAFPIGKNIREQVAKDLYEKVVDARLRHSIAEHKFCSINIRFWKDVAKQYQFGIQDFVSKEDYQSLRKYFVWEGED